MFGKSNSARYEPQAKRRSREKKRRVFLFSFGATISFPQKEKRKRKGVKRVPHHRQPTTTSHPIFPQSGHILREIVVVVKVAVFLFPRLQDVWHANWTEEEGGNRRNLLCSNKLLAMSEVCLRVPAVTEIRPIACKVANLRFSPVAALLSHMSNWHCCCFVVSSDIWMENAWKIKKQAGGSLSIDHLYLPVYRVREKVWAKKTTIDRMQRIIFRGERQKFFSLLRQGSRSTLMYCTLMYCTHAVLNVRMLGKKWAYLFRNTLFYFPQFFFGARLHV